MSEQVEIMGKRELLIPVEEKGQGEGEGIIEENAIYENPITDAEKLYIYGYTIVRIYSHLKKYVYWRHVMEYLRT